jgi:hypothetical protein
VLRAVLVSNLYQYRYWIGFCIIIFITVSFYCYEGINNLDRAINTCMSFHPSFPQSALLSSLRAVMHILCSVFLYYLFSFSNYCYISNNNITLFPCRCLTSKRREQQEQFFFWDNNGAYLKLSRSFCNLCEFCRISI